MLRSASGLPLSLRLLRPLLLLSLLALLLPLVYIGPCLHTTQGSLRGSVTVVSMGNVVVQEGSQYSREVR